jgi:meso-butanediol dehydrogenase / (S,S)-butanediol dehydrogenase / diacetyl reductase
MVTGGANGIGRGIAAVLAGEGARVVVGDIDPAAADSTASALRDEGAEAIGCALDVRQVASVEACRDEAIQRFGRVDILVNNAGVIGITGRGRGDDVQLSDWDAVLDVNLKGVWIATRALLPHFKELGRGKVVNIASIAGRQGGDVHPHYSASKAGVINLTQSLALELGRYNINVNAVCPGLIRTNMWRTLESAIRRDEDDRPIDVFISSSMPLRREQTPEDIGKAVAFFASDDARNITGQALNVDGGIRLN